MQPFAILDGLYEVILIVVSSVLEVIDSIEFNFISKDNILEDAIFDELSFIPQKTSDTAETFDELESFRWFVGYELDRNTEAGIIFSYPFSE